MVGRHRDDSEQSQLMQPESVSFTLQSTGQLATAQCSEKKIKKTFQISLKTLFSQIFNIKAQGSFYVIKISLNNLFSEIETIE